MDKIVKVEELLHAAVPPVASQLQGVTGGLQRAVLDAVAGRLACSDEEVLEFLSGSLMALQRGRADGDVRDAIRCVPECGCVNCVRRAVGC